MRAFVEKRACMRVRREHERINLVERREKLEVPPDEICLGDIRAECLENWHACTTSDLHVGFGWVWDAHTPSHWRKPGVWVQWEEGSVVDFGAEPTGGRGVSR